MTRFKAFLLFLLQMLLKLRYQVKTVGLEDLKLMAQKERENNITRGFLFLPNHVAYVDPFILVAILLKNFHMRPVMREDMFFISPVYWLVTYVNTVPIPDFRNTINSFKVHCYKKIKKEVIHTLPQGECFVLYPSGGLKRQETENLYGRSGIHEIIKNTHSFHLVLVRIRGLWGSRFSCALGSNQGPVEGLAKSFPDLIKNAIFFLPRREVTIEFQLVSKESLATLNRHQFNRTLENWYNSKKDTLALVPYHFFSRSVPDIEPALENKSSISIPKQMQNKILTELAHISHKDINGINENDELGAHLGLDSIEVSNMLVKCNNGIPLNSDVFYVKDIFALFANQEKKQNIAKKHNKWESYDFSTSLGEGNLLERFFRICKCRPKKIAFIAGEKKISYQQLQKEVLLLAHMIKSLPENKLAIFLPQSPLKIMLFLATLLADKEPVVLTVPFPADTRKQVPEIIDKEFGEITTIVSAWKFLDAYPYSLNGLESKVVLLENLILFPIHKAKWLIWRNMRQTPLQILRTWSVSNKNLKAMLWQDNQMVSISCQNILKNPNNCSDFFIKSIAYLLTGREMNFE